MIPSRGETRHAAWIIALFGLVACAVHPVPYVVLDSGVNPGHRTAEPRVEVITDAATWRRVFADVHSNQLPIPPSPDVDFDRAVVVLVMLDPKPTAGYTLHVARVSRQRSTVRVEVHVGRPDRDRMAAAVMTQPYVMLQVDRDSGLETVEIAWDDQRVETVAIAEPDMTRGR